MIDRVFQIADFLKPVPGEPLRSVITIGSFASSVGRITTAPSIWAATRATPATTSTTPCWNRPL